MQIIRWMCGYISMNDRRTNEELRRLVGVEPLTTVIRSGRLRWYGHVMWKRDEYWVKKCIEFRVEGRRLVGRPRRTWLEGSKRHSLHAVVGAVTVVWQTLLQNVLTPPAPNNGNPITVFWSSQSCGLAGWLVQFLIKIGDVGTNPGPTNNNNNTNICLKSNIQTSSVDCARKQVWIRNICHRKIKVKVQQYSSRIGKAQTQSSQHLTPRHEPNTYTCHTLHLHLSPHSSHARYLH